MFCRICGVNIKSNKELRIHLLFNHRVTLIYYYSEYPYATKYCKKCKRELPVTEFYIDHHNTFGYRSQCIRCMRPEGYKCECPLCHRMLQESAVARHLKEKHDISPIYAYQNYLKTKRCPKCKTGKPLKDFYRKTNGTYFSYCRKCNSTRKKISAVSPATPGIQKVTGTLADTVRGHTTSYSTDLQMRENDTLRAGPDGMRSL